MKVAERFSPQAGLPSWIRFQHMARYEWACQFASGKRVVDAACGCGFGSQILSNAGAKEVLAFDLSDDALIEAQHLCQESPQVRVAYGDVTKLPVEAESVDVYVCFETIEHVVQDAAVVDEAWRILKAGGRFLCSSPNRTVTNPGTTLTDHPFNPHHCREYSQVEFRELLTRRFREVELFGQTPFTQRWGECLRMASRVHPLLAVRLHQVRKVAGMYWDHANRHQPQSIGARIEPEFLVASCIK